MELSGNFHKGALLCHFCGQIRSTGEVEVNSKFRRLLPNQRDQTNDERSSAVRPALKELDRVFYTDSAVSRSDDGQVRRRALRVHSKANKCVCCEKRSFAAADKTDVNGSAHRQGLIKAILDIFFGPSSTTHGLPKLKGEAFQSRLELIVSSLMHSKTAEGVQLSLVLCTRIAFGFRTFHADGRGAVGPPPD